MRIFLLIMLLLARATVMAQETVASLDNQNIMYIGVPNSITVVARNTPCTNLTVTIDSGEVQGRSDACKYDVLVWKPGTSFLKIYKNTKKGTVLIASQEIRVKRIPDPVAKIGGKRNDSMYKSILAAQLGVVASLDYFGFHANFIVSHFTIMMIRDKQTIFSKTINSSRFDDEIIQQLGALKSGDMVFVYEIIVKSADKIDRHLDPIYIKVI